MAGNSRLSTVAGINVEAVSKVVTMQYNTVSPLDTVVTFAFRNYAVDAEGNALVEVGDTYDLIDLRLGDIIEWELPEGTPNVLDVIQGIKVVADLAHNKRAAANGV